jgi:choice-of-anchor B domain-containing protein
VYAVGSTNGGNGQCNTAGGLHIVNVQDPAAPTFAGCFDEDGYTHDVQCVIYHGPDVEHEGDEICFASNGFSEELAIVDVTNKAAPVRLSELGYAGSAFTHQGWLTADHRYFLLDDELDENPQLPQLRRTYVFDLGDLEAPVLLGHYEATGARAPAIDHNQFIVGDFDYQANYTAGLSVLSIDDPATASLSEVAYFDTRPENNQVGFAGAWGNYPFFASGVVIVSDINRGLFVLQPHLPNQIFDDGFESGDTSAWSEVSP